MPAGLERGRQWREGSYNTSTAILRDPSIAVGLLAYALTQLLLAWPDEGVAPTGLMFTRTWAASRILPGVEDTHLAVSISGAKLFFLLSFL